MSVIKNEIILYKLNDEEWNGVNSKENWFGLRSQSVISNNRGGRKYNSYVFTEQGDVILSAAVLKMN